MKPESVNFDALHHSLEGHRNRISNYLNNDMNRQHCMTSHKTTIRYLLPADSVGNKNEPER